MFRFPFIRAPYYFGDLDRDPNLENRFLVTTVPYYYLKPGPNLED